MKPKLTPAEMGENLARAMEHEALLAEAERLPTRAKAEVDEEIEGAGVDLEAARDLGRRAKEAFAKAAAGSAAKAPPASPVSEVVRLDDRRPSKVGWMPWVTRSVAAAGFVAAVGGSVWYAIHAPPHVGSAFDGGPGFAPAAKLREDAWADYRAGRYAEARRKLDEARKLYPEDRDTTELRTLLAAKLAPEGGAGR